MPDSLKVLCVHGIGDHHSDLTWQRRWEDAIVSGVGRWAPERPVVVDFPLYDDIFDAHPMTAAGTAEAVLKLLGSGLVYGIGDLLRPRARGVVSEKLRWTAGMVVQWAENETLRRQARERIRAAVARFKPDVVCAHSLGSLVAYDTFIQDPGRRALRDAVFVSFGSQIGNAFVRAQFAGRVAPIDCRHWFHLFNSEDDVFTAPLRLHADNFEQVDTFFDLPGPLDHEATAYLGHANTVNRVWASVAGGAAYRRLAQARALVGRATRAPNRRALLVGINAYPDPADRLEGCVNDVFEVSALLQESGFDAEDIRVVLDDRATAANVRSRVDWLLDGARPGDQRVLYYSGHGAQMPEYAADETVDRINECLVPHDFDWTRDRAITDDELFQWYSELDYATHFLIMLDCCHSGGMTRDGGPKVRGLNPPDDIRHRALVWDAGRQMWKPRKLKAFSEDLASRRGGSDYVGAAGTTLRLGRSVRLRTLDDRTYDRMRTRLHHCGPYLPVILQACQEDELAYEYRHGVTSYGAFTFALSRQLRQAGRRGITFRRLSDLVRDTLAELDYDQRPELVGPAVWLDAAVPWLAPKPSSRGRSRRAKKR